jgi:hypothetical protein
VTDVILGVHRPSLSDASLRALTADQALSSTDQDRALIEKYLKEMGVSPRYAELMFSVPKDQIRWITDAAFRADFEGVVPELKDWLAARCDKRTDVEKAIWTRMMADPRPLGRQSEAERSLFHMMYKKMVAVHDCETETLNELSADSWLQTFDPTCTAITLEARSQIVEWRAAPLIAQWRLPTICDKPN